MLTADNNGGSTANNNNNSAFRALPAIHLFGIACSDVPLHSLSSLEAALQQLKIKCLTASLWNCTSLKDTKKEGWLPEVLWVQCLHPGSVADNNGGGGRRMLDITNNNSGGPGQTITNNNQVGPPSTPASYGADAVKFP